MMSSIEPGTMDSRHNSCCLPNFLAVGVSLAQFDKVIEANLKIEV